MGRLKKSARKVAEFLGYEVYNKRQPHIYSEDGLSTYHCHSFVDDPIFQAAYARGIQANGNHDHNMRWRAHIALWVAKQASSLDGDFVECGVSTGFLSSAIMQHLEWNKLGKRFFLFDTYEGLDSRFVSDTEAEDGRLNWYSNVKFDKVRKNFQEFEDVHLVKGTVPETLSEVEISRVCYLSLDMNCTEPEIAALSYFWDKLVPGGFVLLDDYAYSGYEEQHFAFNEFAKNHAVGILTLPTGQGLILKPSDG